MEEERSAKEVLMEIWFTLSGIPPSVNHLYYTQGKKRFMSKEGRLFRKRFLDTMGGADPSVLSALSKDIEQEWELSLWLLMKREMIYTKGWKKNKRVKSPFQTRDATNYIKSPEDCIAKLLGLPDKANFRIIVEKRVHPTCFTVARLRHLPEERNEFPEHIQRAIRGEPERISLPNRASPADHT